MYGLAPYYVRILCEGGMEGIYGYKPADIGDMTLDQIFMLLADKKLLRKGKGRVVKAEAFEATPDEDGYIKGRDKDGNPMKAKIGGESLASRLAREHAEEQKEKEKKKNKRRRRRKRKNK